MINGTTAAGMLVMVMLLQLTVTCGQAHPMRRIKHDSNIGNDIQLVRHFLSVNV